MAATAAITREFWALVREGFRLPPELVREYPLDAVAAAHRAIAAGEAVAHTVLRVSDRVH